MAMSLQIKKKKKGGEGWVGGGHRASFLVLHTRELEIRLQHIALVTAVAFGAWAALVTALQGGRGRHSSC